MQDRRPGKDRRSERQDSRPGKDRRNERQDSRRGSASLREGRSNYNRNDNEPDENRIEGRNAVIEAYRAGRTIEKLYLLEGPAEGAMQTVLRLAKDNHTPVRFLSRQRLDQLSQTGKHQGVISCAVVGVQDPSKNQGQMPVGMIQIKDGLDAEQVIQDVTETIQKEVEVRSWLSDLVAVKEMPHTGMGKIDYKKLAEDYEKENQTAKAG